MISMIEHGLGSRITERHPTIAKSQHTLGGQGGGCLEEVVWGEVVWGEVVWRRDEVVWKQEGRVVFGIQTFYLYPDRFASRPFICFVVKALHGH
jgi:hypothetical protein